MKISYSDKPLTVERNSIFLAGPTPRSQDVKSWRPEAIKYLENIGYEGQVIVPERESWEGTDYIDQVEWEDIGLNECAVIVFWIPRDLKTMPALTTNIEFGRFCQDTRMLYGRPNWSPKNRYLDWLYKKSLGRYPFETLATLMTKAYMSANIMELKMNKQYYFLDICGLVAKQNEDLIESDPKRNCHGTLLYVTPADYFDTWGAQADWTESCVFEALVDGGFHPLEFMDGVIEFAGEEWILDKDALKKFLANHPNFEENAAFEKRVT
ncbi:MAG TPA: nucleoside 2-deoxyribosyltransferase domain-containing protein [Candidatus Glassbacteria bacterium]|nr:nucleoside 2-deoxyribosyltransferase domain-containing protein [Candidatus Glassbacteria bacterium]